jgi:hypothetical protein
LATQPPEQPTPPEQPPQPSQPAHPVKPPPEFSPPMPNIDQPDPAYPPQGA